MTTKSKDPSKTTSHKHQWNCQVWPWHSFPRTTRKWCATDSGTHFHLSHIFICFSPLQNSYRNTINSKSNTWTFAELYYVANLLNKWAKVEQNHLLGANKWNSHERWKQLYSGFSLKSTSVEDALTFPDCELRWLNGQFHPSEHIQCICDERERERDELRITLICDKTPV